MGVIEDAGRHNGFNDHFNFLITLRRSRQMYRPQQLTSFSWRATVFRTRDVCDGFEKA